MRPLLHHPLGLTVSLAAIALSGCAVTNIATPVPLQQTATAITGSVRSGQQPIAAAHVHLLAVATSGYGSAAASLLAGTSTGQVDSLGAYVLSDASGSFTIPAGFSCASSSQVYLYATGGKIAPYTSANSATGLLAAVGACPAASTNPASAPSFTINEVTTVAAAYALAGFATDATHISSSGTSAAQLGVENAFSLIGNLVNPASGAALSTTPYGNGTPPQKTLNTLANILHACVASSGPGSSPCATLFSAAESNGATGTAPSDTATAAINIAHFPAAANGGRVATMFAVQGSSATFAPALINQPNDFALGISYTGGGINGAYSIAIDSAGNPWIANLNSSSITRLSPTGVPASPSSGFVNGNPAGPAGITIDVGGDAWVVESYNSTVTKFASSGALLSPFPGYSGGGIQVPQAIASDAIGNIWVANYFGSVTEFSNSGLVISPQSGYMGGGIDEPVAIAIDAQGGVWTANAGQTLNSISKFSNSGYPLSPPQGFTGGGIGRTGAIAIDAHGSAWVANFSGPYPNTLSELSNTGVPLSPATGYSGGGLNVPFALAIDGAGNVWAANGGNYSVSEFDNNGNAISPSTGYTGGGLNFPEAIAIDGSGNVWIANTTGVSVVELVGAATPVVTPLALAIKNSTIATRP